MCCCSIQVLCVFKDQRWRWLFCKAKHLFAHLDDWQVCQRRLWQAKWEAVVHTVWHHNPSMYIHTYQGSRLGMLPLKFEGGEIFHPLAHVQTVNLPFFSGGGGSKGSGICHYRCLWGSWMKKSRASGGISLHLTQVFTRTQGENKKSKALSVLSYWGHGDPRTHFQAWLVDSQSTDDKMSQKRLWL